MLMISLSSYRVHQYYLKLILDPITISYGLGLRMCLKLALEHNIGNYVFLIMSFGLINAHETFIGLMNRAFKSFLVSFVIMFIDDIHIYSKSKEDNTFHIHIV